MANDKVFGSDITRTLNELKNNLYDLLTVSPVNPLPINITKKNSCDFVPKTGKYFIPKRKIRPKVKTVRDIRNLFEKDINSDLSTDLEKQETVLLRKIRSGSSRDEKTKLFANNLLKSGNPISRTAWQMLININPDNCAHSSQYVLWNRKCIQVNGSRGGKSKFICKYDLDERRISLLQKYKFKKTNVNMKKDLLKHSLNIKFKPGPLSRKKHLDLSYQKYNIGNIDLVHLPKPGLDILPEYGKPIDTCVANFLHNLRDVNGIITDKWAEFAVSALGTSDSGRAVLLNKDSFVTFDLSYKYNQSQLLMRYDVEKIIDSHKEEQVITNFFTENEEITKSEVQKILDDMLTSVEINLMENEMYTGEDPPREVDAKDINNSFDCQPKEKVKRKGQSELNRLDVTVIRLCDTQEKQKIDACRKSFCTLGCICDSILSSFRLKSHCGQVECMFECRCDFNKYSLHSGIENDIIPGLVSLDKENNSKLSKEEQKFHQTVILSGEKSILLQSQRRNWKAPERYAEFYSNMRLKTKKDSKRILSVVEVKINCGNIEPWCMIHNLYKCFCKGKFTEKLSNNITNDETKAVTVEQHDTKLCLLQNLEQNSNSKNNESTTKNVLRPRIYHTAEIEDQTIKSSTEKTDTSLNNNHQQCARSKVYKKRKYSDVFYFNTNKKIMELEQNDHGLQKRLMEILKIDENCDSKKPKTYCTNLATIDLSLSPKSDQMSETNDADELKDETEIQLLTTSTCHKPKDDEMTTQFISSPENPVNQKLKAWLEPSLKTYRHRFGKGFFKKSLEPPKAGKIALYPWDFIMNRYHEKKNLFLATNQKPFRIFMAVDNRNSLFHNCTDISYIQDLDKYPVSVKNIIAKKVDRLKDQLCILRGLNFCWELVGSVKKVCDGKNIVSENKANESFSDVEARSPRNRDLCTNSPATPVRCTTSSIALDNTERSKWFVLTIENDFSEIQFYNRGFFVKYESIVKAINVARVSNKTVRLSSQKCNEGSSDPQFGIYAIPNANEYCVFIGPYEKNDPLGIETVKTTPCNQKKKTRGVWITTNKVDNFRVIDNPLSFMSQVNLEHEQILDDSSQDEVIAVTNTNLKSAVEAKENNKVVKLVKPITITKTNNFYHLTPSGFLKPISGSPENPTSKTPILLKKRLSFELDTTAPLLSRTFIPQLNENKNNLHIEEKQKSSSNRPIAEIAPQVKVREECRENISGKKFEGGMFVLKPEEINSRSLVNKINFTPLPIKNTVVHIVGDDEIDMDIENFLANSVECSAPTNDDVYVISDDEDYCNNETSNDNGWKDVWIICRSVRKIGWISGRRNADGYLSFEFPGFKYTAFYPEKEAYSKMSQVLARKVYIPENVKIYWSVVETMGELKKIKKLNQENLNPNYVLTKWGLVHKSRVAEHLNKKIKTYKNVSAKKTTAKSLESAKEDNMKLDLMRAAMNEMDTESNLLIEEGEQLLNETILIGGELSDSFSKMANDHRQRVSDRLRSIISNGDGY